MSRPLPQSALARRALTEDSSTKPLRGRHRSRFEHGLAIVGVTALGLGVTGSAALTGNAQYAASTSADAARVAAPRSVAAAGAPAAFDGRQVSINRSAIRPALGAAAVDQRATRRAESLLTVGQLTERSARAQAAAARAKSLHEAAEHAKKKAEQLKKAEQKKAQLKKAQLKKAAQRKADRAQRAKAIAKHAAAQEKAVAEAKDAAKKSVKASSTAPAKSGTSTPNTGHASLPITSGFHIAAHFGQTGSWSRYHTGIDFAAPMHTPIHAAASGVVTHAGSGSAGWAGHYVAIRHADGKSTLYAHMSTVSVHVGEHVTGGQRIGAIGMTGRSFGPHVHFELYPAGVKPGNLYHAINPAPWLHAKGLHY